MRCPNRSAFLVPLQPLPECLRFGIETNVLAELDMRNCLGPFLPGTLVNPGSWHPKKFSQFSDSPESHNLFSCERHKLACGGLSRSDLGSGIRTGCAHHRLFSRSRLNGSKRLKVSKPQEWDRAGH